MSLHWDITEVEATAFSVLHDDGMPFEYRFSKEGQRWANETEAELILGPSPSTFETLDAAKQWAERNETRVVSSST